MDSEFDSTTSQGMAEVLEAIGEATEDPTETLEDDHGEETLQEEEVEEVEEEAETAEDGEDGESGDEEGEPEDDAVNEDSEALEISPEDFAQLLGVEEDQIHVDEEGNAVFIAKVDGETANVTMQDLVKSFQTDAVVTKKSQALSNDRKEFDSQRSEYLTTATQRLNETAQLTQYLESSLLSEFNNVDWNTLKATDPNGYMLKRQDFNDKQVQLNQVKQALTTQGQALSAEQQRENAEKQKAYINEQANALLDSIPAWHDPEVAQREHTAINEFAKEQYGFSDDELSDITEHRALLVLRDAMKYRSGKSKVDLAEKKIKKLPKKAILKPKGNKKRIDPVTATRKKRKARFAKTGSTEDALALLNSMDI